MDRFAETFERIMGCRAAELLNWLPRALPGANLAIESDAEAGRCRATFEDGLLLIEWRALEPAQIALLKIPRLAIRFNYSGLGEARRQEVQGHFDRATQRGGG